MTSTDASPCGPELDRCHCKRTGPVVRTDAERRALHVAAVKRAAIYAPPPAPVRLFSEAELREKYVQVQRARRGAA